MIEMSKKTTIGFNMSVDVKGSVDIDAEAVQGLMTLLNLIDERDKRRREIEKETRLEEAKIKAQEMERKCLMKLKFNNQTCCDPQNKEKKLDEKKPEEME